MVGAATQQAAAIIQSEGVFIDNCPFGKADASESVLPALSRSGIRNAALWISERRSVLRKRLRGELVETCSNYPEPCGRDCIVKLRIRQPTVLSMIGPNRAAVFNRGQARVHIESTRELSEWNRTALD
jgi:hypothetical protein